MTMNSSQQPRPADSGREVRYLSSADASRQPALFHAPQGSDPIPLLVILHTWSSDYRNEYHQECFDWCVQRGWAFIHPDFRGPNVRPEATGSDLVVGDILSAVAYARGAAPVDPRRIYLIGTSGGGHAALLMAGRAPEVWAGISAWVPVVDLGRWHSDSKRMGRRYEHDIEASCGGPPGASPAVDAQYRDRSPLTWLHRARSVPLDINAGILDGHTGSVPIWHSLTAFNAVALPADRIAEPDIEEMAAATRMPARLRLDIRDPLYGRKVPLFRRQSGKVRVTIFDGGHELVAAAGLGWLACQVKGA